MNQLPADQSGAAMPDRVVLINNQPFLFFSGTAYLCMNHNHAFTRLLFEGMQLYGTSYGSSRSGNFSMPVYDTAEQVMAEKFGAEAALTLSSGFMSAQLVIRHFETKGVFLYAPDSHPALLRTKEDYYTGSFSDWQKRVNALIREEGRSNFVVIGNSLDPLKLQPYEFSWINELPADKTITVILDDSHGLGVTGRDGNGIYASLSANPNIQIVVVSSLAKAMGMPGGLILANRDLISSFRKSAYFSAASPMAPAYLHAFLHADRIYEKEQEQLLQNIRYFQDRLPVESGIRFVKDYPVFACPDPDLARFLQERNILISSFAYPTPADEIITRIIINSHHTFADLDTLLAAIHQHWEQRQKG